MDFPTIATVLFGYTTAVFAVIIVGSFIAITWDYVIDYIVRRLGGVLGLFRFLAWALGLAMAIAGASWLFMLALVALIAVLPRGTLAGMDTAGMLRSAAAAALVLAMGTSLWWACRPPVAAIGVTEEQVLGSREALYRWGHVWIVVAPIAWFPFFLLAQGQETVRVYALLIGASIGAIAATFDFLWRRWSR